MRRTIGGSAKYKSATNIGKADVAGHQAPHNGAVAAVAGHARVVTCALLGVAVEEHVVDEQLSCEHGDLRGEQLDRM